MSLSGSSGININLVYKSSVIVSSRGIWTVKYFENDNVCSRTSMLAMATNWWYTIAALIPHDMFDCQVIPDLMSMWVFYSWHKTIILSTASKTHPTSSCQKIIALNPFKQICWKILFVTLFVFIKRLWNCRGVRVFQTCIALITGSWLSFQCLLTLVQRSVLCRKFRFQSFHYSCCTVYHDLGLLGIQ